VYLGVLARRTLITSNVVSVLEAANGKPIIFMPARHDHHRVQTGDGYAAFVAGQVVGTQIGVTSEAQASWWGGRGVGTVPHALIAAYGGNTVLAATKFAENADPEMNVTVLVDFENDSVQTALDVARALGPRLWGVRLDTSGQLVDRSLWGEMGDFHPRGVKERLPRAGGGAPLPHHVSRGAWARCATPSTMTASSGSRSSSRAVSTSIGSGRSKSVACRSTPTAWAR